MTEKPNNIYTALNAVMAQVGYVKKQRSPNLNYTYAGEAALIAAIRPELVEQGVIVYISDIVDVITREYTTAKGAVMNNVTMTGKVTFYHAESGTSITVTARGEGSDSGDKANNKAATCLYKYALRQTLMIETGDDPDRFQPAPKNTQAAPEPMDVDEEPDYDPQAAALEHARAFKTADGKSLGELTRDDLLKQQAKAAAVPEEKRGEKYWTAVHAVELVLANL